VAAPSAGGARVSLADREALLVRTGLPVTATASGRYGATFGVALAVDVPCDGATVRLVSTHLELDAPPVQLARARELTAGPGAAPGPLVLVGDFNTWPDERGRPTYEHLPAAGFADAWSVVGQGSGLTHGHAPDLRTPRRASPRGSISCSCAAPSSRAPRG
jgi:endonuclease/exonuclease/phosphatase family metal-dependent hydrolase